MRGLRRFEKLTLGAVILLIAIGMITMFSIQTRVTFDPKVAEAVTKFAEVIPGVQTIAFTYTGASPITTGGININKFVIPFKAEILGFSTCARLCDTSSGNETYTLDIKEGGVSLLSGTIAIYQTTMGHGTISDNSIAADATVTIVLTAMGTTPAITDLTTLLTIRRTN